MLFPIKEEHFFSFGILIKQAKINSYMRVGFSKAIAYENYSILSRHKPLGFLDDRRQIRP